MPVARRSTSLKISTVALFAFAMPAPSFASEPADAVPPQFFERCTPFQTYGPGTPSIPRISRTVNFSGAQKDTIGRIIQRLNDEHATDPRIQGYVLGTIFRETASTLRPVGEGKSNRPYMKPDATGKAYFGRGYIQLTGRRNYESVGRKIGVNLVDNPDKALDPDIALEIAVRGMLGGWFTGKRVSSYFTPDKSDWYGARAVVNPKSPPSHKPILVKYAIKFTECLTGSRPADPAAPKAFRPSSKKNIAGSTITSYTPM